MPKLKCPGCERKIELKENHFGRKLKCKCGQVFRVPKKPVRQEIHASPQQQLPPIQFSCPTCMMMLQVDGEMAGRTSACPCGTHVPIPTSNGPFLSADDPFGFPGANQGGVGLQTAPLPSSIPRQSMTSHPPRTADIS